MKTNMRILYIIGQLSRGGAEQQLYYLLSQLPEPATVLSLSSGGYWAEPIRQLGHDVIELKRTKSVEFKRLFATAKIIKEIRPDIIHIFLDGVSALYARLVGFGFNNSKLVVGERNLPVHYPKLYRLLLPYLNRRVSLLVPNSMKALMYYQGHKYINPNRLIYIPNAIDINFAAMKHKDDYLEREISGKYLIVGTVARITYQKNPTLFIRVAAAVHREMPDVRFWMVGDGDLRGECESLIKELKLEKIVKMWGLQENVAGFLKDMDIFTLFSRYEGTPNALLEAMTAGLPCVVTDAGDSGDIVKAAECGLVADANDITGLSRTVLELLKDSDLRIKYGQAGWEYIMQNHTVSEMSAKYLNIYNELTLSAGNTY